MGMNGSDSLDLIQEFVFQLDALQEPVAKIVAF